MTCSVVVIVDRSGSMEGQYLHDAKMAAETFIGIMHTDDSLGVVAFSTTAEIIFGQPEKEPEKEPKKVTLIASETKQRIAQDAVDGLSSGGLTNMGQAFATAAAMLAGTTGRVAEVFLSDGEYTDELDPVEGLATTTPIYTIALGPAGPLNTMARVAKKTFGKYHPAPTASALFAIYDAIAGEIPVAAPIVIAPSTVAHKSIVRTEARVPEGATLATFAVNWSNQAVVFSKKPAVNKVNVSITDPTGNDVEMDPNFERNGFVVFKVRNPVAGVYTVYVWYGGTDSLPCTAAVFDNNLSINAAIAGPQEPVPAGSPATVDLRLADGGDPIDGARVEVILESPLVTLAEAAAAHAERLKAVSVPDDIPEEHQTAEKLAALQRQTGEDLLPREERRMTVQAMSGGLYRVQIPSLEKAGSHTVHVVAHGYSAKSKTQFQRSTRMSFIAL